MTTHNLSGVAFPTDGSILNANTITSTQNMAMVDRKIRTGHKKLFSAHIEVTQVANGYLVSIGKSEGYDHEVHIATTIAEVNDIIAAQMVAFRLEDKT